MRQRSRGWQGLSTAEDMLPAEVRRRRCERGLTREELASRTGYSRQYISQLEQPSRGIPARPVLAAVDAALEAGGALVDLREAAVAERAERRVRQPDAEVESRRRIGDLLDHRRSDRELDYLDRLAADLIAAADALEPADVTARVLDQQTFVDQLLRTPMLPHQQFRLFMIAGHLAGLLAISLLDVNELAKASTCCLEAAVFTELTGHEGLRAWTLAVNSLIDAAAHHADGADSARAAGAGGAPSRDHPLATGADRGTPLRGSRDRAAHPLAGGARDGVDLTLRDNGPAEERPSGPETTLTGGTLDPRPGLLHRAENEIPSLSATDSGGAHSFPQPSPDETLIAPGGRATPPRLIALVKRRIARFATASAQRATPPMGISHSFRPPV
ncbi:putative transcriptional regulator [Frankia sp. EI5c]|uniref:helix-turn-helix domain-containing protein n=1 Tax=Frankia sp. EI5c TaxID=683316 RepID=UPI0007C2579A|nr:helix-turn-helix transcriptional regulator [Frankia sp. EI5c]OAA26447.1 putative transcriptional regulator [Frankia sp. EI5c]